MTEHDKGRDCERTEEVLENYRRRALAAERRVIELEGQSHGVVIQRRMIVKGWKIDGYRTTRGYPAEPTEFTSYHSDPSQASIDYEVARIGAPDIPGWQPHITEVIVEERVVTPWVAIRRVSAPEASGGSASEGASSPEEGEP